MQIITRTRTPDEIVPAFESDSNVRDEVNRRTCKAGYTDSDGQQMVRKRIISFGGTGETKYNVWPRDENGNLID